MTTDQLLDDILRREGGDTFTNDPDDKGGGTKYGITARTLGTYRGMARSATIAEIKALTEEEARAIYTKQYVGPWAVIPFDQLKAQLVDFTVTSDRLEVVKALQRCLGVEADGIIGERTKTALYGQSQRCTNNALVAFRCQHYAELAEKDASQRKFLRGWVNRAVDFVI